MATAPLPDSHRELIVRALGALHARFPAAVYTVVDYDPRQGRCTLFDFDCSQPWPEASLAYEYHAQTHKIRRVKYQPGSGPVLWDQELILPRWHPCSSAAHALAEAAQVEGLYAARGKGERPRAATWRAQVAGRIGLLDQRLHEATSWEGPRLCRQDCPGCYLAVGQGKRSSRHKTAIRRTEYSRPIKNALRDGLLAKEDTILDYGCGQGEDVELLEKAGYRVTGWDPVYRPLPEPQPADIVNLGYVINVIEDPHERMTTLARAYNLTRKVLIVSAQLHNGIATRHAKAVPFGDGVLTSRGTFQRFFRHKELREYIEATLGARAHPVDFGIYYVFKDAELEVEFIRARKDRGRPPASRRPPKIPAGRVQPELLKEVARWFECLGRLPCSQEHPEIQRGLRQAGTQQALLAAIHDLYDPQRAAKAAERRKGDLLVLLASSRFSSAGRPLYRHLSEPHRADIIAFWGSYAEACKEADALLMGIGDPGAIDRACLEFGLGKLLPDALYIHVSLETELPPTLRALVACARHIAEGELPPVHIIKIKRTGHGVTFSECEDFDTVPHPCLRRTVKVDFVKRKVIARNFIGSENPPVLHRKDLMVATSYPHYETFRQLTQREEEAGLLSMPNIGHKKQWEAALASVAASCSAVDTAFALAEGHRRRPKTSE